MTLKLHFFPCQPTVRSPFVLPKPVSCPARRTAMDASNTASDAPLPSSIKSQPGRQLLRDVRHLVTDLGEVVTSALGELLGHGYGHTNVHVLNVVSVVQFAVCVYWAYVAARTPLHNIPEAWKALSWIQLFHTRLALAVYNPTNWLATTAYQLWMTTGSVIALATISQAIELGTSHACLTKTASQAEYCPYTTVPDQADPFSCTTLPPIASPCPVSSPARAQFMTGAAVLQCIAFLVFVVWEYVKLQSCRLHALDNIVRANHCVHDHRAGVLDDQENPPASDTDNDSNHGNDNDHGHGRHRPGAAVHKIGGAGTSRSGLRGRV